MKIKKLYKLQDSQIVFIKKKLVKYEILLFILFVSTFYFSFYHFNLLNFILLYIGLYYYFSENGTILDLQNLRYSNARIFFNRANCKWNDLPEISYVSVFKTTMVLRTYSVTNRCVEQKEKIIMINLIHHKNKRLNVYQTYSLEEGEKIAKRIAAHLHVPIYKSIGYKKEWLNVKNN